MEKYSILYSFIKKQQDTVLKLFSEIKTLDLSVYENKYVFALKVQQAFTAIEDVFKSIAKTFENSIDDFQQYHIELLKRMNTDVESIRPQVITYHSFHFLNKLRSFRHFIRHAYDYELDQDELQYLQKKVNESLQHLEVDLNRFLQFVKKLSDETSDNR